MATTNTWDQVVQKITGVVNRGAFSKTYTPSTSKQTQNGSAGYYSSITTACNAVSLTGNASTSHVLSGKTFYTTSLTRQTGTMTNRGNLNWSGSNTTYSVPAGYYSGGTLDSRPSYNNGVNAGKNSVSGGGVSKSYSATANNVRNNAPNYKLTGISGTGYIIGFIWIKRVWGRTPSRTFTVTNGSPSTVVNYVWDNYQNRNSASEMGMWFVKVRITNASNASAYFTIGHEYNPEFLVSIHFFRQ